MLKWWLSRPPGVGAAYNSIEAGYEVGGNCRRRTLDSNPTAPHLVRDSPGCSGASKRVEDEIARISSEIKDPFEKLLRLGRGKRIFRIERLRFFTRLVVVANI